MPRKRDILASISERLDIPREALPGSFGLTLAGERELTVRGCKRILLYGESCIALSVGNTALRVMGSELYCTAFSAGCVTVTGRITGLLLGEASFDA